MGDENEGGSGVVDLAHLDETRENLEASGLAPADAMRRATLGVTLGAELHANEEESTLRVVVGRVRQADGGATFDLFCYVDDRPGAGGKLAIVPATRGELLALRDRLTAALEEG